MAKVYDNATDLITFARSSSGTALRRVGYSDELVVDGAGNWVGDFDTDTDWELLRMYISGGTLNFGSEWGANRARSPLDVVAGKTYSSTITCNADGLGSNLIIYANGVLQEFFPNIPSDTTQTETIVFTATQSGPIELRATSQGAVNNSWDNFSVKEVIFDRPTDDLVLFNHPDDIPRIEYAADGSLKGLLIEEQRTNLVTHSDFSGGWAGQTQVSLSRKSVTSPTGQQDAMAVTSLGTDPHIFDFNSVSSGNDYTFTVWLKGVGNTIGRSPKVWMLTNTGTVSSVVADTTPLTSEWRRYTSTGTCTASGEILARIDFDDTGLSASGEQVYAFGAQVEEGPFPTSYIPTSGSTVTRSPDIASIPVSAFGYNQDAGAVVVEASFNSRSDGQTFHRTVELSNGPSSRLAMFDDANESNEYIRYFVRDDTASNVFGAANLSGSDQSEVNLAIAYAADDMAIYGGNGQSATGSSGQMGTDVDTLNIGKEGNNTSFLNGHIKSLQYYPRRLTDAQLQELTS